MALSVLLLQGCTMFWACQEAKQFYVAEESCPSGYLTLGITGHSSYCAEEREIQDIKKYCWVFF
jgi:hypothetical protein